MHWLRSRCFSFVAFLSRANWSEVTRPRSWTSVRSGSMSERRCRSLHTTGDFNDSNSLIFSILENSVSNVGVKPVNSQWLRSRCLRFLALSRRATSCFWVTWPVMVTLLAWGNALIAFSRSAPETLMSRASGPRVSFSDLLVEASATFP